MRLWLTVAVLALLALAMLALAGIGAAGTAGAPTRLPHPTMSGEFDQRPLAVQSLPGALHC